MCSREGIEAINDTIFSILSSSFSLHFHFRAASASHKGKELGGKELRIEVLKRQEEREKGKESSN